MKKYVLVTGCSYAFREIANLQLIIEKLYNKSSSLELEMIDLRANSAGNEFISESSIIGVKSLLDFGIEPKNILVINNFTQIYRPVVKLPYEYHSDVEYIFKGDDSDTRSFTNITYTSSFSLLKLQNEIYSFLIYSNKLNGEVRDWFDYQSEIHRMKKIPEQYFEKYLENIVVMQSFLNKFGVFNISFLMNNVFEGWGDNLSHIYNEHKTMSIPNLLNTKHISDISDYTKSLWSCINFENFLFHKTENNNYGGIDEYMLDRFCNKKYLQDSDVSGFIFGNHPNGEIYKNFANDYMIEKLNNWVNEIYS